MAIITVNPSRTVRWKLFYDLVVSVFVAVSETSTTYQRKLFVNKRIKNSTITYINEIKYSSSILRQD